MRVVFLLASMLGAGLAAHNFREAEIKTARRYFAPPLETDMAVGTNFVFSFLNSHLSASDTTYTENLFLTITNPSAIMAQVTISSQFAGFNTTTTTVPPKISTIVQIQPPDIQVDYMDKQLNSAFLEVKSIWVTSTQPIKLVATNQHSDGGSEDAFAVIPICQLGTDYIIITDESADPDTLQATNIVTVIATVDGTEVDMTPLIANVPTLSKGQQLSFAAPFPASSLRVNATAPVAVISGAVCGFGYGEDRIHCSHEALMLYPVSDFGTQYPVFKFLPQDYMDVMIMFAENGTQIQMDDYTFPTLFNSTTYLLGTVDPSVYIQANKPIYVAQVGNANLQDQGAPFLVHATPPNLFTLGPVTFATALTLDETDNMVHYVRVVTELDNIGSIKIDGYVPNGLLYRRMGMSPYYFFDLQILRGQHIVSSTAANVRFSVTVYGYGLIRSYAFNPGLDLPTTGTC